MTTEKTELRPIMLNAPCDRCGKTALELRPYKFSPVVYRGKPIEMPWLCMGCFRIEKKKAWAMVRT